MNQSHLFAIGVNNKVHFGDIIASILLPESIEDRERITVLKNDSLVPIKGVFNNAGASSIAGRD